jgi:hypothetical protein
VGEGGIEKWQWRCARGEAGETERDTETDSHSNGARSEQRRAEQQSRAAGWSRAVGHGDRGRKRQRKKLGLVGDMSKIFALAAHGLCVTVPSLNSLVRELGKPQHHHLLATTHTHHSSVTPPPATRAQRAMHSRSRGCRLPRPILVERNRPVGRSRSSSAV